MTLFEVNEAAEVARTAATDDANIIFGAVQDETMGADVNITVIATGFKQQEMPQRRERMLAEATLPTVRFDVPIQPRVSVTRPIVVQPTETEAATDSVFEVENRAETTKAEPELIPVPASVFDDDFFRTSPTRSMSAEIRAQGERTNQVFQDAAPLSESRYSSSWNRVQEDESLPELVNSEDSEKQSYSSSFAGFQTPQVEQPERDELDIPAFLRRSN